MQTVNGLRTSLRTEALTARVTRRKVREFYRVFSRQHPSVRSRIAPAKRVAWGIGAVAMAIGLLAMVFGIIQEAREQATDMAGELFAMSAITLLMVTGGVLLAWYPVRTRARRGTPKTHYRLAQFASENDLTYEPGPLPGSHVTPWAVRGQYVVTRVLRPRSQRLIEFANYEVGSGAFSNQNTRFGGYCALQLSTHLPHIVLHARDGRPDLLSTARPANAQILSLEGDFDEHFTLWCPEGYERDALYLFTPDVMARLIDRVRDLDVEIIDDWLFLTSSRDLVTLDPEAWRGLIDATSALGEKVDRWERWRDDRVEQAPDAVGPDSTGRPPISKPIVAKRGRRLRMTIGPGVILGAILGAIYLAATIIANLG
jgi:hypothetical protein